MRTRVFSKLHSLWPVLLFSLLISGCVTRPGTIAHRTGDEIVVAGNYVHTGTPVVLWSDPGGYDAYRVERRFAPIAESDWNTTKQKNKEMTSPARYSMRQAALTDAEIERVRGGGWDLPTLQRVVDQFVIHFDVAGTSRTCFKVLHDARDLSVHFMLDVDGTIYQTLDCKEKAWHATSSNGRSVGIEIANMGAYPLNDNKTLAEWYKKDDTGHTALTIPARYGEQPVHTPNFHGKPARKDPVIGETQGHKLKQYDFTPQQYEALAHLTATLCTVLPKITCDYPHDKDGKLIPHKLAQEDLDNYHGVMGHFHVQTNKTDPGPAFQWDYVIGRARQLMVKQPEHGAEGLMHPVQAVLLYDNR
ncbi:MAG: negative regulator of beta-lactamase expression [Verrucomicrobiales bacterium]|nr:negative regulator of beta-lactamase expression [Verrucomicrobiales bacterium]